MQKNNPNNYLKEDEIDLRKLIFLLLNSRKTIIVITLIGVLISAGYWYTNKPHYMASGEVINGHYYDFTTNDIQLKDASLIEGDIRFLINNDFKLIRFHGRYLRFMLIHPSEEFASNAISEIIDYYIEMSNRLINKMKKSHINRIENLSVEIKFIEQQLKKISEMNEDFQTEKDELTLFLSAHELETQLNRLKSDKQQLELKLVDPYNYKKTELYNEIAITKTTTKRPLIQTLLFGSIAGFLLSIIVVFLKQVFIHEKT